MEDNNIPTINENDVGPFAYRNLCNSLFAIESSDRQPFIEAFFEGDERLLYLARRMPENRNFIVSYAGIRDGVKYYKKSTGVLLKTIYHQDISSKVQRGKINII